ncbi:MAG: hypothetical protein A2167_04565 [Planctomycetes bacterium RBG_13_46_10]|nr:MAG: hypothetical protein A2167_04565 [Planctomycetes bacterium RBG_13_46_10]
MEKDFARKLVKDVLEFNFERRRFVYLARELLNHIEETPETVYRGNYIPDAYKEYIAALERIGKYEDPDGKKLDVLVVQLKKETSLERARTMQRNFVAWYLNGSRGGVLKDAALVAFVSPAEEDWRFSFVKMEYKLAETAKGIKAEEEFTPARRYSFLVGKNETTHTAQSRLVPILCEDEQDPNLKQLEEAFSIEKVTKEFFEKYRELFLKLKESLDELVKKSKEIKTDFEAKKVDTVDFAKKLLGQIVFLYFLQKKGWFGVKRGQPWGLGSKHFLRELLEKKHSGYKNFFNDILEPLFYEALRLERPGDYYSRFDCRIPFLNGGLFDPINEYDWVDTDILLPNELFSNSEKTKQGDTGTGILDVFDRYNFTVKEDEPLEKEVAIDPEMLGKVFENLLEVKDRKSKGTYYTPREIVHYMCQQSLINYLASTVNIEKKPIASEKPVQKKFFGGPEHQQLSLRSDESAVSQEDVTSLILHGQSVLEHDKTVETKGKETKTYSYRMPQAIRENAAVLDKALESVRVCDPAVGSGAFLVGMMHEIVNARLVLSTYLNGLKDRTQYDFKRDAIQDCLYGVDIDPSAVEIAKLRLWLSLVVDEEERQTIKPLPNLDYKIVCGNSLLGIEKNLLNQQLFDELERLKQLFFNETSTSKKQKYKEQINELIYKITNGHTEFDFEVYFSEVFHEKGGFDVVIANPPYIFTRKGDFSKDFKAYVKKHYFNLLKQETRSRSQQSGKINLFGLFLMKGLMLTKNLNTLTFILPNTILRTTTYNLIRKYVLDKSRISQIVDLGGGVFDEVTAATIIFILQRYEDRNARDMNIIRIVHEVNDLSTDFKVNSVNQKLFNYNVSYLFNIYADANILNLTNKISACPNRLGKFTIDIIEGIVAHKNLITTNKAKGSYPLLEGKSIKQYVIERPKKYIIWDKRKIHRPRPDYLWEAENKIIIQRVSGGSRPLVAALDCGQHRTFASVNNLVLKHNYQHLYKYVLALLNSKTLNFYYCNNFSNRSELTVNISKTFLESLPVPEIEDQEIKTLNNLVDKILDLKGDVNYVLDYASKLKHIEIYQNQIDQMVYELYGLTKDEIDIVEGRTKAN